jgi:MSHA biogenesis protein MshK
VVNKSYLTVLLMIAVYGTTITAQADTLRDPLRPVHYQVAKKGADGSAVKKQPQSWQLSAVLISRDRTVAVVNGQSMQVGDQIDGYKLLKIEPAKVLLQDKQKQIVLHRSGTGMKKAVSSPVVAASRPVVAKGSRQ